MLQFTTFLCYNYWLIWFTVSMWHCMKFSWFMWDALCDLVPFAQFQKVEKHPRRSVTVNNVAGLPWVFFTFSKVCKLYHIAQNVSYESRRFHALSHTNSKSNQTRPNSIFNPSRRYPKNRKNNPKFLFSHFFVMPQKVLWRC